MSEVGANPGESIISLWKTSHRGMGERHLGNGYSADDFPGEGEDHPDGCAYFARECWIAEQFAAPDLASYEDWMIETTIPEGIYRRLFMQLERPFYSTHGTGVEVRIPRQLLDELNRVSDRHRREVGLMS